MVHIWNAVHLFMAIKAPILPRLVAQGFMNSGNQTPADQFKNQENRTVLSASGSSDFTGPGLKAGDIIADRYKVLELLGHGGMGSVYKVEQIFLRQFFAMKTLTGHEFPEVAIRRFQKEAQAASKLNHPNLIKAHDFGLLSTHQPFFVMDLIVGENLSEYSKRVGTLSLQEVLKIFIPVCFALGYAHSEGIVHRDLKPGNIMLDKAAGTDEKYTPKVVDFGIAKLTDDENGNSVNLTRTGEIFGTPLYMSPEQCLGTKVDHRTDVYSLGCVMYEALTGAPPFHGDSALSLMMKHQSEEAQSLKEASMGREFPELLEAIVRKTMAKNPDQRYQNLLDVAQDLVILQQDQGSATSNLALTKNLNLIQKQLPKKDRRISWKEVSAAGLLGLLSGAVLGIVFGPKPAPEIRYKDPPADVSATKAETLTLGNDPIVDLEGSGKDAIRIYHFPRNFSVGVIKKVSNKGVVSAPERAQGNIRIPMDHTVELILKKSDLLSHPQLLRGFGEYDINYLVFQNDKDKNDVLLFNSDLAFDAALTYASKFKALVTLNAVDTSLSDVGIGSVRDCPFLLNVDVSYTKVTARGFRQLKNFPDLHVAGIGRMQNGNTLLPDLFKSKTLVNLNVEGLDITDADMEKISRIKTLKILNFRQNPKVTDKGVAHLKAIPGLISVMGGGTGMTPASIPLLSSFKDLKLTDVDKDHWSLKDIEKLQSVTKARIAGTWFNPEKKRIEGWDWKKEP